MTLRSRGFEPSKTSRWGRRPTVIHGGDFEFSFSNIERDRDKDGLGYLTLVPVVLFSIFEVLFS